MSRARQNFHEKAEEGLNNQINAEFQASYVYLALHAYFARDDVALPGLAKFFLKSSHEEREHAEKLMNYLITRGGRLQLKEIKAPETEFDDPEKGDALNAVEKALALEKAINVSLLTLHKIAEEAGDPQMCDFIEGEFLKEQVESIKTLSDYVAQLRRVGKGHGTWAWDHELSA
jgi:ferritin heavy chain